MREINRNSDVGEEIEQKITELHALVVRELSDRCFAMNRFCKNEQLMRSFCSEMSDFDRYFWKKMVNRVVSRRLTSITFILKLLRDLVFMDEKSCFLENLKIVNRYVNQIDMFDLCDADAVAERQRKLEKSKKPQKKC